MQKHGHFLAGGGGGGGGGGGSKNVRKFCSAKVSHFFKQKILVYLYWIFWVLEDVS